MSDISEQTEQTNQDFAEFTKRPKRKKLPKFLMACISIVVCLSLIFLLVFQQGWIKIDWNKQQNPSETPKTETAQKKSPPPENNEIAQLRAKAEEAFFSMIQAQFTEDKSFQEKVDYFETIMDDLGKAYYKHYVTQEKASLEDAKNAMMEYIYGFSVDFDGVPIGMSDSSAGHYAEKVVP
jgi:hypothetical protein